MPSPNAGCQTCKIRRVKCDGAQPVCQACLKSHRVCSRRITVQSGPVIHIENPFASGQKKRPRGPRSTPTLELDYTSNSNFKLQPSIFDLKTQAVVYYLHYHLQALNEAPSISRSVSDDLLPIWKTRTEMVDLAVSSMALAVCSRTQQHRPASVEAFRHYHRLLQMMKVSLSGLNAENVDACLLAVFFMSRYEMVMIDPSHQNRGIESAAKQSFAHHDGALAILKTWNDHMSDSHCGTDAVKHTRRSLIKSALLRNLEVPKWMLNGASFGERGLELQYDRVVVRIAVARRRLSVILKEEAGLQTFQELISEADELNKEVRDIDKALQAWIGHFAKSRSSQEYTLSDPHPWPLRDFYSPRVLSYPTLAYATVWNNYYATRILINSTRLTILKIHQRSLNNTIQDQRLECLSNINMASNNLASSVPFCLQRFRITANPRSPHQALVELNTKENIKPYIAGLVVWPLSIASCLGDVDAKHKLWFRSELARIGRMGGDQVLESADADEWFKIC